MKRIFWILGIVVFAGNVFAHQYAITKNERNVLYPFDFKPSCINNYTCVFPKGTSLELLEKDGHWYKVKGFLVGKECIGWISGKDIDLQESFSNKTEFIMEILDGQKYMYTKHTHAYLLREPDYHQISTKLIAILPEKTVVKVLANKYTNEIAWFMIECYVEGKKSTGWIRKIDLHVNEGAEKEFKNLEDEDNKKKQAIALKIIEIEAKAKQIPVSNFTANLKIYEKLVTLNPENEQYKEKVKFYRNKLSEKRSHDDRKIAEQKRQTAEIAAEEKRKRLESGGYLLELLTWHWHESHGYVIAEGQVKNISGSKLERVQAVVTWYDKNRFMITYDTGMIDFDPILSGQVSPFKVFARFNPAMKSANIEFKFMWGGSIEVYHDQN